MRYDTKVVFVISQEEKYNPDKGEYEENATDRTEKIANVTDLGTNRSAALFGDIKQGAKVIRLLRPYDKKWDYVLINVSGSLVKFKVVTDRKLRSRNTFIVQEVNS